MVYAQKEKTEPKLNYYIFPVLIFLFKKKKYLNLGLEGLTE